MVHVQGGSTPAPSAGVEVRAFLIADVRGYTAFTLEHGDEAAARLAARFAELVESVVEATEGRVVELRGDEALAVFASARRALGAAVSLQEKLADERRRDPALPLHAGVGLDAGEAIPVRDGFRGAALNMAARLCSLAGPGEVLASDGVVHLARKVDGIEYQERGLTTLKGFADPVRVMRVVGETRDETAPVLPASPTEQDLPIGGFLGSLPGSPLVARSAELGRALAAVEGVAAGTGRMALLSGEPGVGKTRLAQEVTLQVRNRGFSIAAGRCYEAHQAVSFYPFVEALTGLFTSSSPNLQTEVPLRWPDISRLLPSLAASTASAEGAQDQQRLFWAVTGFVQAISDRQPVALFLDDLHWADAASLELLQHLARHTRSNRVLLLGTFRDVEVNRQHPLEAVLRDLQREDLVERIDLWRLEQNGTAELMAASMGEEEISDEFSKLVYQRTEGNPFFVQQVMRVLVERGDIFRKEGRWDRKSIAEIEVPESIRSVVGQRLSRLTSDAQEVLYEASVLGQAFRFDDLEAMTGRPEREIEDALVEAAKAGLVRETDCDLYSFDHALTQQSLYADLSTRRRRRLHVAAGEAIGSLPGRKQEGRAAELAWHFLEGDDPERALPWSLAAGKAAAAVFAYSDAELHYRTAAELAKELERPAAESKALEELGRTLYYLTRLDEALTVLERAVSLYREANDQEGELRSVALIGAVHGERLTRRDGIARLEPVLASAPDTPSGALVELQVELARLYFLESRYEETMPIAERATSMARTLGDERLLGQAQTRRASTLAGLGRAEEANVAYREAIALTEATGDLFTLGTALNNLTLEQERQGRVDESIATRRRQVEVARRLGTPGALSWVLFQEGMEDVARGQFAQALIELEESAALSRSLGPSRSAGAAGQAVALRLIMGDEAALTALKELADASDGFERLSARISLAGWYLLREQPADALTWFEGLADDSSIEPQNRWLIDLPTAAALVRLGEIDRAETIALASREEAEQRGVAGALSGCWRTLAEVRAAQGTWDEARELFTAALEQARHFRARFSEGQTLYEWGEALLRSGQPSEAREPLMEALTIFREIGAAAYVAGSERLLARAAS
jgi:class 3 adenylate cyclase/tetratricopeptide (TPR) repeat protein